MLFSVSSTLLPLLLATSAIAFPIDTKRQSGDWDLGNINVIPGGPSMSGGGYTTGTGIVSCPDSATLCHEMCHTLQQEAQSQCYDDCYIGVQIQCEHGFETGGAETAENLTGTTTRTGTS